MSTKTKVEGITEGLQILMKYGGEVDVSAEHEVLWAGSDNARPENLSEVDRKEVVALGWIWDPRYGSWKLLI